MSLTAGSKSKRRTPFGYLAMSLWVILVLVMAYGMYHFPAAPYSLVNGQYVDKRGQIHSMDDVEHLHIFTSGKAPSSRLGLLRRRLQSRRIFRIAVKVGGFDGTGGRSWANHRNAIRPPSKVVQRA